MWFQTHRNVYIFCITLVTILDLVDVTIGDTKLVII